MGQSDGRICIRSTSAAVTQLGPPVPDILCHAFARHRALMHTTLLQVDLPQGVCVVGDAATCFNLIYGQGMTVGIKGAILLRDTLQKRLQGRTFSSASAASALSGFSRVRDQELLQHVILKSSCWHGRNVALKSIHLHHFEQRQMSSISGAASVVGQACCLGSVTSGDCSRNRRKWIVHRRLAMLPG